MGRIVVRNKGVTLIELLVVLVISSILVGALYRTFVGQQKTYTIQDQVVDMQQNVRIAMDTIVRYVKMAGYGNINYVLGLSGGVNVFTSVITIIPGPNQITIVGAFKQIRRSNGEPIVVSSVSGNQVTLNYATDEFDSNQTPNPHRYISIGGIESNTVSSRTGATLTLSTALTQTHSPGSPVYKIQAITYKIEDSVLKRDENTGGGAQPMAENIENLQFVYYKEGPPVPANETTNPADIRMVKVTIKARTSISDPEFKGGDGYRRRTLTSNIKVRNLGL